MCACKREIGREREKEEERKFQLRRCFEEYEQQTRYIMEQLPFQGDDGIDAGGATVAEVSASTAL